jgi:hypothetical protein
VAKLSLWAEFSPFPSWHRKYIIEKNIRCAKRTQGKNEKEIKSNLQNKHDAAHWCREGGGVGREAKLSLWAEFSPFPSWHRKYVIEKFIRCSKRNISKNVNGNKSNLQNKHVTAH